VVLETRVDVVLDFDFDVDVVVDPDATTVGLPAFDFVGLVLAVPTRVDFVGLLDATGLLIFALPVVGLATVACVPTEIGFAALVGLTGFEGLAAGPASADDTVRDAAASTPMIVVETRMRVPPKR
jgi:hypothetical protein